MIRDIYHLTGRRRSALEQGVETREWSPNSSPYPREGLRRGGTVDSRDRVQVISPSRSDYSASLPNSSAAYFALPHTPHSADLPARLFGRTLFAMHSHHSFDNRQSIVASSDAEIRRFPAFSKMLTNVNNFQGPNRKSSAFAQAFPISIGSSLGRSSSRSWRTRSRNDSAHDHSQRSAKKTDAFLQFSPFCETSQRGKQGVKIFFSTDC